MYNGVTAEQAAEWGRSSGEPERNAEILRLHEDRRWSRNLLAWWFGLSYHRIDQIIKRQRQLREERP